MKGVELVLFNVVIPLQDISSTTHPLIQKNSGGAPKSDRLAFRQILYNLKCKNDDSS
jgi:hypothetical protein